MYRFRCLAHAFVTAAAIVAWGGVVWGILAHPNANDLMRLPWFAVLAVAAVSSGLALQPLLAYGADGPRGRHAARDERALCEAFYWWGREDEAAGVEGGEVPAERADALLRLVR